MANENPHQIALGVDGGGTHTRVALLGFDGTLLGTATAGPSNYQAVGRHTAEENIQRAVAAAWATAGQSPQPATVAFLGMAGVISQNDRDVITSIAEKLNLAPREHVGVDHDLRSALAGGLGLEPGIVLIAGTGSSCYGRTANGTHWRAGGWGHLLDDVGGGYWLGVQGLIAVARAADGRGATTSLTDSLLTALKLTDVQDLLHTVHDEHITRADLAALAPLILDAANNDDMIANELIHYGAEELARMVQAVAQRLGWIEENVQAVIIGGLGENQEYAAEVASIVGKRASNVQFIEPRLPPVLGATLLALEMMGVDVAELLNRTQDLGHRT